MGIEKLGVRSVVTVIFGPFIIFCAWKGGYVFLALIISIVSLAMYEFYDLAAQKVTNPEKFIGIAAGVTLCLMLFLNQLLNLWILIALALFILVVFELFRNQVGPILNIATTFMGIFYVSFFLGFLILIRELPRNLNVEYQVGGTLIILIFLSIWICDSAAYILGSRFGNHKLFERVSPNKTIEGTIFGFIFAVLTAYVCYLTFLPQIGLVNALVIGAVCGSVGQISDLLESLFKRDARVKDSSNLIPGHGGILDRFDSEILVAPVVYFYLRFIVF
ncbi:MAG: phosphatidate cytidylyltransferase [bacterium]